MLKLRNVTVNYGKKQVLKNISLEINKGSVIGVIGGNGAGKSTLLSIIATVIEEYSGEIYFNNIQASTALNKVRKIIGYVPQAPTVFEDITVKDNIDFWWKKNNKDKVDRLLNVLELDIWLNKKVKTLSGGTKNRLNILIGIINNPEIIILDEPLVGVSLSIKKKFFELINELAGEGKIILMASHELWEIESVCTEVLIIKENTVSTFDSVENILSKCKESNISFWDYLCQEGGL